MIRGMALVDFKRPLVLATASEARRKLVADTGLKFFVDEVEIDESPLAGESVGDYVMRLARAKAEAVVPPSLDAVVVTVDTAIGLDKKIIGKPNDEEHARAILNELSGRAHEVASAIVVRDVAEASLQAEITRTQVAFVNLTEPMIDWYISTGEWKGRAGAYAIQGKGAALIADVRGCFTNVIGISIPALIRMLSKLIA